MLIVLFLEFIMRVSAATAVTNEKKGWDERGNTKHPPPLLPFLALRTDTRERNLDTAARREKL